jgi:hypothetical protein
MTLMQARMLHSCQQAASARWPGGRLLSPSLPPQRRIASELPTGAAARCRRAAFPCAGPCAAA